MKENIESMIAALFPARYLHHRDDQRSMLWEGKRSPVFLPSVTFMVQSVVHVTIYQRNPTVYGALCSCGVAAYIGSACTLYSILDVIIFNSKGATTYLYS